MSKPSEQYHQPSQEKIEKAEELMTEEQKEMSENRKWSFEKLAELNKKTSGSFGELIMDSLERKSFMKELGLKNRTEEEKEELRKKAEMKEWEKKEPERRWERIYDFLNKEELKRNKKLSDHEKLSLIQSFEDRNYITINDLRHIKATGFFVSDYGENLEFDGKTVEYPIIQIENGEIKDEKKYRGAFAISGNFVTDYESAHNLAVLKFEDNDSENDSEED